MFQWMLKLLCTWNPLCPKDYVELTSEKKKQNQKNTKEKMIERVTELGINVQIFGFYHKGAQYVDLTETSTKFNDSIYRLKISECIS